MNAAQVFNDLSEIVPEELLTRLIRASECSFHFDSATSARNVLATKETPALNQQDDGLLELHEVLSAIKRFS